MWHSHLFLYRHTDDMQEDKPPRKLSRGRGRLLMSLVVILPLLLTVALIYACSEHPPIFQPPVAAEQPPIAEEPPVVAEPEPEPEPVVFPEVNALRVRALDDDRILVSWEYDTTDAALDWSIDYGHTKQLAYNTLSHTEAHTRRASTIIEGVYPNTRYMVRVGDQYAETVTDQAPPFEQWEMQLDSFHFFDADAEEKEPHTSFPAGKNIAAEYAISCAASEDDKDFELLVMARLEDGHSYVKVESAQTADKDAILLTGSFYPGELGDFTQPGRYIFEIYADRAYLGAAELKIE